MAHALDIAAAVVLQPHGTHARVLDRQHGSAAGIEQGEVNQQRMRGAFALAHLGQYRHTTGAGEGNTPQLDRDERQAIIAAWTAGQQFGNQLERTVQQRRVQVQACQFVLDGSRDGQLGQHTLRIHPGCGHGLVGRAVVQAHRAGQRQVLLAGKVCRAPWQRWGTGFEQHTAGFARQARDHVLHPLFALRQGARNDAQGAVGPFDLHAHFLAGLTAQQQRVVDFELLDVYKLTGLVQLRHGQRQLGKASPREQHRLAHLVVGKGRVLLRIQAVFPGQCLVVYRVAQQRVHTLTPQRAVELGAYRQAEMVTLPGIVGQAHLAPGHREAGLPLGLGTGNQQASHRALQQQWAVVVALEGANHLPCLFAFGQYVIDVAAQDRVRAHLHEQAQAAAHQGRQCPLEQYREANVLPPVVAVQALAVQLPTHHGGIKRNLRGARADVAQVGNHRLFDGVHRW
ncbi:hypothetical protein D3C76_682850 [compost metagenome]